MEASGPSYIGRVLPLCRGEISDFDKYGVICQWVESVGAWRKDGGKEAKYLCQGKHYGRSTWIYK